MAKITISVIKAYVGGYVGHSSMHPDLIGTAKSRLGPQRESGRLIDFSVLCCGDDLHGGQDVAWRVEPPAI
jgi:fructose 1,6-bisphosphate aldolase/phosphatase